MTDTAQQEFLDSLAYRSDGGTLRGDYSNCDADYVVQQNWSAYADGEHALWRRLYERQAQLLPGRACAVFIDSLSRLKAADAIPQFDAISAQLEQATGWRLVAVPGLVPDEIFFRHLSQRRFPVTVWLRKPEEFDYIVEPDVFHDFFGHVPLLFNPVFADHMQAYGQGGLKALALGGLPFLARLYWYTIEFGLIQDREGLRAYGAGILSSGGEIDYCLRSPEPKRLRFNLERVMRTDYKIDSFQANYFVIHDFEQLFDDTAPDFTPLYRRLQQIDSIAAGSVLADEVVLDPLRDVAPAAIDRAK